MKITVRYMAQIKKMVGSSEEVFEISGSMTAQVFIAQHLCQQYVHLTEYLIEKDGSLCKTILIFHGDEQIDSNLAKKLQDGDVLTLIPPITGG